ncbi:MAG: PAS domain S-box protein [Chloroflexota bacterium]
MAEADAGSGPYNRLVKSTLEAETSSLVSDACPSATSPLQREGRRRERDEQYRSVFEATSDGIIISDLDGFVVEANPAACAMHGYNRDHFQGLHRTAYVHPDFHDRLDAYVETIQRDGEMRVRGVNLRRDGSSFPVEVHGTTFSYRGKPRILALLRDVTEECLAQDLLEKRVRERTRELATLLEVSRQIASTLQIGKLCEIVLDRISRVIEYRGASLLKLDGDDLVVIEYSGPRPREQVVGLRFSLHQIGSIWQEAKDGRPVIIDDVGRDDPLARAFSGAVAGSGDWSYIRSWMAVPLVIQGKTFGLLGVSNDRPNFYSEQQAHLASALVGQVAVAMENAKLYRQAQEAAALEERARLARELHDSVTQTLFSMTMHAEAAQLALDAQAGDKLSRNLGQLTELANGALAEMRALIFELRPGALQEEGLVAALRKHSAAVSARERLRIEVHGPDDRLVVDPSTEEHLYFCAQEALHNVVKHAHARGVVVRLADGDGGMLTLEIEDDGVGFDPSQVPAGHLGVRSIGDRVDQIGGSLEILSFPGAGTTIRIRSPRDTRVEDAEVRRD